MDTSSSYGDAWASFQKLTALRIAGEEPDGGFSRGRGQFLVVLARIQDAAAHRYLRSMAERLASIPGVEPFTEWQWHITIKGLGFQVIKRAQEDDILRQDVPRIVTETGAIFAQEDAFKIQLGLPNCFPDVAFVEIPGGARCGDLHRRLLNDIAGVHRYPIDEDSYLPHISIARFTSNEGLNELKATLEELRNEDAGPTITIDKLELVKAWLSEGVAEFETIALYPLQSEG